MGTDASTQEVRTHFKLNYLGHFHQLPKFDFSPGECVVPHLCKLKLVIKSSNGVVYDRSERNGKP